MILASHANRARPRREKNQQHRARRCPANHQHDQPAAAKSRPRPKPGATPPPRPAATPPPSGERPAIRPGRLRLPEKNHRRHGLRVAAGAPGAAPPRALELPRLPVKSLQHPGPPLPRAGEKPAVRPASPPAKPGSTPPGGEKPPAKPGAGAAGPPVRPGLRARRCETRRCTTGQGASGARG